MLHLKRVRVVKRHRQVVPSILEKEFKMDVSDGSYSIGCIC